MAWGVGKLPLETTGMEETIAALRLEEERQAREGWTAS
jgi:hypothetical protein